MAVAFSSLYRCWSRMRFDSFLIEFVWEVRIPGSKGNFVWYIVVPNIYMRVVVFGLRMWCAAHGDMFKGSVGLGVAH